MLIALIWCAAFQGIAGDDPEPPSIPEYTILRAAEPITLDGKLDEPSWKAADPAGKFVSRWPSELEEQATVARMLWDDQNLYVAFVAEDHDISAVLTDRDAPVSEEDCVEVFVAPNPDKVEDYFNFEFNALGTLMDRAPFDNHSKSWNAEGVAIKIAYNGSVNDDTDRDESWTAEIAIPLENFNKIAARVPPKAGDVWRINLYRIDGREVRRYSAWSDTATPKPSFHVPDRFGFARFSATRAESDSGEAR